MDTPKANVVEPPRPWHKPRVVWVAVIGLVVFVVAIVIVVRVRQNKMPTKVETVIASADAAKNKGNYEESINDLKAGVSEAKTTQEKLAVYNRLAMSSSSAGKLDDALNYYDLKHKLDPSTAQADASILGGIHERKGQKDKAIEQYRKAIEYAKKNVTPEWQRDADVRYYNLTIERLNAKQ